MKLLDRIRDHISWAAGYTIIPTKETKKFFKELNEEQERRKLVRHINFSVELASKAGVNHSIISVPIKDKDFFEALFIESGYSITINKYSNSDNCYITYKW